MSLIPPARPYDLVRGLRVVRNYRPDLLEAAALEAILEAGRWTGSSKNAQDWAFIVIGSDEQRGRLAGCGRFTEPMRRAPLVIPPVPLPGGNDFDIGRLAQNMMLAAWSMGIGSCPITLHDEPCARRVLAIPDDHVCRWVMSFGYPDEEREVEQRSGPARPAGRKPLGDLVHDNIW